MNNKGRSRDECHFLIKPAYRTHGRSEPINAAGSGDCVVRELSPVRRISLSGAPFHADEYFQREIGLASEEFEWISSEDFGNEFSKLASALRI